MEENKVDNTKYMVRASYTNDAGVDIGYLIRFDFSSFLSLVDGLGGEPNEELIEKLQEKCYFATQCIKGISTWEE